MTGSGEPKRDANRIVARHLPCHDGECLIEAIEGPASIEVYGFRFEAGLPERIANDVEGASARWGIAAAALVQARRSAA